MRTYKIVKPIESITLTPSEMALAKKCNQAGKIAWSGAAKNISTFVHGDIDKRKKLKAKIKRNLRKNQQNYCYYCGIDFSFLRNEDINSHIDHFYPKGAPHRFYERFVLETMNLVLSCSICNGLGMKGENDYGINHYASISRVGSTIIHPYFDDITEHFKINEESGVIDFINKDKTKAELTEKIFKLNKKAQIRARLGDILVEQKEIKDANRTSAEAAKRSIPLQGRTASRI